MYARTDGGLLRIPDSNIDIRFELGKHARQVVCLQVTYRWMQDFGVVDDSSTTRRVLGLKY